MVIDPVGTLERQKSDPLGSTACTHVSRNRQCLPFRLGNHVVQGINVAWIESIDVVLWN